jgi:hypothetical protein
VIDRHQPHRPYDDRLRSRGTDVRTTSSTARCWSTISANPLGFQRDNAQRPAEATALAAGQTFS